VEEATVTNATTDTNQPDYLLPAYNALCSSYHAIDDFRAKLLGFLPLVTGGGLVLLSGRAEDVRKEFFGPVGRFGILVTLGLLAYELFGIKKCHALIQAGQTLEREMHLPVGDKRVGDKPDEPAGQFIRRPNNLLWVVNEPFAAALIYPAVLAAWSYLAVLYDNPSHPADPSRAQRLSLYVFVGGFALILLYDAFLRNQDELRDWWKRRRSPDAGHERANDQPSQAVSK
jgi:hypothetical protein